MEKDLIIGSHVSLNAPEFFLGSVKEALSYGANALMFYTGAPQNSYRKPLNELRIEEGLTLLKSHNIALEHIIVHAPYIINLANYQKIDLYEMSANLLRLEINRTNAFSSSIIVLHPGSSVGLDREQCFLSIAKAIDNIYDTLPDIKVKIALETMSGKGSEIGITFEEIAKIISLINNKDKIGVCLDTCHIHDGGYDLNNFDEILNNFDEIIGLDKLLVIHLNDSKNIKGAHKDRHENIGYGEIGFDVLSYIAHHPRLSHIPKILETPYYEGKAPYKKEIEMIKNNRFEKDWRDKI